MRDRDREIHRRERGAYVRRHIIVALRRVHKHWIAVWHEPLEECLQVPAHVGIRILLNEERSGCMADMKGQQSVLAAVLGKPPVHLVGALIQPAPMGRDP